MASYQSGFDPPSRPGAAPRGKRPGTSLPQPGTGTRVPVSTKGALAVREGSRPEEPRTSSRRTNLPKPTTRTAASESEKMVLPNNSSSSAPRRSDSNVVVRDSRIATSVRTTKEGSNRRVLRRKTSNIGQQVQAASESKPKITEVSSSRSPWPLASPPDEAQERKVDYDDDVEGYYTAARVDIRQVSIPVIPELDRYRSVPERQNANPGQDLGFEFPFKHIIQEPPPPTPLSSGLSSHSYASGHSTASGYSASPSTRFSESPGPGPYSRNTTPTSVSSQSPGIIAPVRLTPRLRQASPSYTRPPVTRLRMGSGDDTEIVNIDDQGLPSLRESLTSSSSNSTVKGSEKAEHIEKAKKKKKRLSPLPPSPPPRTSSQKKDYRTFEMTSPTKTSKTSTRTTAAASAEVVKTPSRPAIATTAEISKPPIRQAVATTAETSPLKQRSLIPSGAASMPPRRPSRDGTPDLQAQFTGSPAIVQSNMSGINFSANKRFSATNQLRNPMTTHTNADSAARPIDSSRLLSRQTSPSPVRSIAREGTPAPSGLGIVPDLRPTNAPDRLNSRTPSPSVATPRSRFGFFTRRTKTAPELPVAEKDKSTRKGPVAGTGHEGYGRYARRRSNSFGGRDRSQSNASSSLGSEGSLQTHDQFLMQRMSPVIIAGGGEIISNQNSLELTRTDSSQSLPTAARPSLESKHSQISSRSGLSKETARASLWPSALPRDSVTSRSSTSLASKASTGTEGSGLDSSRLALRRSMHRLQTHDLEVFSLPPPISVDARSSSAFSSRATSSIDSDAEYAPKSAPAGPTQSSGPRKLSKRPRSPRKWNFFQRSQSKAAPDPIVEIAVPVVVNPSMEKKVAHYAMIDSEAENEETMNIEDILLEAEVVDLSTIGIDPSGLGSFKSEVRTKDVETSRGTITHTIQSPAEVLLVSSPQTYSTPQTLAAAETLTEKPAEAVKPVFRPSRLPQVGRIPHVVSARPRQTSPKSFSRPFARISTIQPLPDLANVDRESIAVGVSPAGSLSPLPPGQLVKTAALSQEGKRIDEEAFLVMPKRNDSEVTTSSSSGTMSFAGTTAIIPSADAALEEDEVWDEYDDLIEPTGAMKVPVSATSSNGVPFQYEQFETRTADKSVRRTKESPVIDVGAAANEEARAARLDLGTLRDALALPTPTTPMSFTDIFAGYGDRHSGTVHSSGGRRESRPLSTLTKAMSQGPISRQSTDPRSRSIAEHPKESPVAQVNLRVGSMTVSKWLTFSHVLFSPAREDVQQSEDMAKHHSILVIDSLGNDDWSFYAAETYPQATFYNLSPSPSSGNMPRRTSIHSLPQTPENHRQVQYTNTLDKFPFPRDTFTVVVLRFPTASPEANLRNLIAEAKRVLKPGGYLELSILDLDMMNMGNQTRRAVRALKVQLSVAEPSVSLAPASDTILRQLNKRGFRDIKSCRVGIPVASAVPSANDDGKDDLELSLADMMRDQSSAADTGITKMVAKVGRWWFLRCYEMPVLPNGDVSRSIFAHDAVLAECEKWNSSFKLLVCHAQKPATVRRRTASV